MKPNFTIFRILALAVALIAAGQTAWADNVWSVTYETYSLNNRYTSFTVSRTETGTAQTVKYRTVSLTALAGKYFEENTGELVFAANEDRKTVIVHEQDPEGADLIYRYWTYDVPSISYRFEALDQSGAELAHCDRHLSHSSSGYDVDAATLLQNKEITVFSDEKKVDDAANGFGQAYYETNASTSAPNAMV